MGKSFDHKWKSHHERNFPENSKVSKGKFYIETLKTIKIRGNFEEIREDFKEIWPNLREIWDISTFKEIW